MKKYGNWTKFKDLSKKDKIFRIVNIIFAISLLVATIGLMIYYLKTGDKNNRFVSCIGMSVLYILPFALELILRRRFSNLVVFFYLFYALIAGFVGCVLNIYHEVSWFDIVVHTCAGYVFCFFGIIILSRLENYKKLNPFTIILFCFFCTLAVELVWELVEWFSDLVLGQTAQGDKINGIAPYVTDTDLDMLCNLSGGLVFVIQFAIGKFTKFKLGTTFLENELTPKENVSVKNDEVAINEENGGNNSTNISAEKLNN